MDLELLYVPMGSLSTSSRLEGLVVAELFRSCSGVTAEAPGSSQDTLRAIQEASQGQENTTRTAQVGKTTSQIVILKVEKHLNDSH